MATTSTSLHTRSISLPSRSHPLDTNIEHHLRSLRASDAGPSSSSSVCQNLFGIKDLYEQMNTLIHLPHNQKAICRGDVEDVLAGSLALLDASGSTLDVVSQMKETVLDLQSSLRRGNSDKGISAYLASRRKINKIASKRLADLKKVEKKYVNLEDNNLALTMIKEAEAICLSTFRSLLSFMTGKSAISQTRGWSMVKKLVKSKNVPSQSETTSEVEEVDRSLLSLSEKQPSGETIKVLLKQLEAVEIVIHELEDGLESVSRCIVKARVSLLNVLNH